MEPRPEKRKDALSETQSEELLSQALSDARAFMPDIPREHKPPGIESERQAAVLMGETSLRLERFDWACEAFAAAEYKPGLIACGEKALAKGDFDSACKA